MSSPARSSTGPVREDNTTRHGDQDTAFPWWIGVYDAHCHPTDIMASTESIPEMKTRGLTVMSTRAQDQGLVEGIAGKFPFSFSFSPSTFVGRDGNSMVGGGRGEEGGEELEVGVEVEAGSETGIEEKEEDVRRWRRRRTGVVPAFGWHPWFSHQMVDDRGSTRDVKRGDGTDEINAVDAREHYMKVLTPTPKTEDEGFVDSLQRPFPLSGFLAETEDRLKRFPTALVGEIGLDRGFRLPKGPSAMTGDVSVKTGGDEGEYTPGSREGRALTPYRVSMDHQKVILKAQLEVAAKYKRAVSVHSVQAHGLVFEVLQSMWKGYERPSKRELIKRRDAPMAIEESGADGKGQVGGLHYPPRICMHSYSGPAEALRQFLDPKVPADIFFSFSECVNFGSHNSNKAVDSIKAVPADRILVESDLHCAGEQMDELLADIVRRVCDIKGWALEDGVRILKRNWERFIFGT